MNPIALSPIILFHIITGLVALILGPFVHLQKVKAWVTTRLGRIWIIATLCSVVSSFGIYGPEGASVLHLLSLFTLGAILLAGRYFKQGKVERHQRLLVAAYFFVIIAFFYSLRPGRYFGQIWNFLIEK